MNAQNVLDFWFGAPGSADYGKQRAAWFRKDARFDAEIRERFGDTIAHAVSGGLRDWDAEGPQELLARLIVLDQFTRNARRGTPGAFEGDALALAAARKLVDSGAHRELLPVLRQFAYLPFEHAEDARAQEQAVELFTALANEHEGFADALDYAHRHRGVIARFGRFPHRNLILGRANTPEEAEYLMQPGAGF
ncbi:DUF924 domain-containing protein [Massilia agilis]|uniref:DUF924 domain-containing protein n=1 Tax=Massilia agilis TaxID=1811226 RepID=A0ABT2DCK5_9BURK|nr:DUF924 family protein [Massilia agilis]MCS0809056.1 DUF924 domain-containing protein [Massilia agilis]